MPRGCFRYRSLMRFGTILPARFRCTKETSMSDILFAGLGLGLIALFAFYALLLARA